MHHFDTSVLIAGGGPVGLTLALELERHGIDAILIERNLTTTRHPKMDITNGRSMEIFRRLGLIDKLREVAVPSDHQVSVVWATNLVGEELARFDYPSVDEARSQLRENNDGRMALEPAMRVSQVVLEPVLKEALDTRAQHIDVRFGWGLESFEQDDEGVTATIKCTETGELKNIRSRFLAGCDGANSVARKGLGIPVNTITPLEVLESNDRSNYLADYRGEPLQDPKRWPARYQIHFKSSDLALFERFGGHTWHLQLANGTTVIAQNDSDTWTMHLLPDLYPGIEDADPKDVLYKILGCEFDCEVLVSNRWYPQLALADNFGSGRVWLAGDAVRQVIPTGGYGMNTGIGDAMALGWVLAANVDGWAGSSLFAAYEVERRHVAARNRLASGTHAAVRYQISRANPGEILFQQGAEADAARASFGDYIRELGNLENEAWGIECGYRYDDSPIICHEGGQAPPYEWEYYEPTTWPGGRAPNVFMSDGKPLFDVLGTGMTLLNFSDASSETLVEAADAAGVPLKVINLNDDHVARLYEKALVLVRPDQHVAWRADQQPSSVEEAAGIFNRIRGA